MQPGHVTVTSRRRSEIKPFTGLRGIAAWIVALYHFRSETPAILPQGGVIGNGEYAVDVFFIMSGYVLMASYGARFRAGAAAGTYLRFIGHRLGRIYPAHLLVLLAYLSIPLAYAMADKPLPDGRFQVGYFVASLMLIQNWGPFDGLQWNVPSWTISAELLFYLAFPLVSTMVQLRPNRHALSILLGAGIYAGLIVAGWSNELLVANIDRFGAGRCLLECSLGAWLFAVADDRRISPMQATCLQIGSAGLVTLFCLDTVPDYVAIPGATMLLLTSLLEQRNLVSRLLSTPVLLALGRWSFASYIVHYLIKDVVKLFTSTSTSQAVSLTCYVVAVLLASMMMHKMVERPAQNTIRRWVDRVCKS